jgi:hypothetical protein
LYDSVGAPSLPPGCLPPHPASPQLPAVGCNHVQQQQPSPRRPLPGPASYRPLAATSGQQQARAWSNALQQASTFLAARSNPYPRRRLSRRRQISCSCVVPSCRSISYDMMSLLCYRMVLLRSSCVFVLVCLCFPFVDRTLEPAGERRARSLRLRVCLALAITPSMVPSLVFG